VTTLRKGLSVVSLVSPPSLCHPWSVDDVWQEVLRPVDRRLFPPHTYWLFSKGDGRGFGPFSNSIV